MMSRHVLTALLLSSVAAMPLTAHAYLTPEEVLDQEDYSTRFYDAPPSAREIEETVAEQNRRSAERREAEQEALWGNGEDPAEEEPLHGAAPDEEDEIDVPAAPAGSATLTSEEQRLLERLRAREEQDARDAWMNAFGGNDEPLHGGAPLSDTGPGAVVAALAVAGAIGETWRRVRKANRD